MQRILLEYFLSEQNDSGSISPSPTSKLLIHCNRNPQPSLPISCQGLALSTNTCPGCPQFLLEKSDSRACLHLETSCNVLAELDHLCKGLKDTKHSLKEAEKELYTIKVEEIALIGKSRAKSRIWKLLALRS